MASGSADHPVAPRHPSAEGNLRVSSLQKVRRTDQRIRIVKVLPPSPFLIHRNS